jgi:spore germination protein
LKDTTKQQRLIDQTITTATDNKFGGIVLDLELSALPFDAVVKQITSFVSTFSQTAKQHNVKFAMLMYGDTFYRLRPFDMKALGRSVDEVMIMSYDFSKANGDPGPNFPLSGQESYGYDMQKMVSDFSQVIAPDKLVVVFGRYGYDWTVDDNGHSQQTATAVTDLQAQNKFVPNCSFKSCTVYHDPLSAETKVTYVDDAGKKHVVWFEDANSIAAKEKYLRQHGVSHFADWAYSYF